MKKLNTFTLFCVLFGTGTNAMAEPKLGEPLSSAVLLRLGGTASAIKATKGKTVLLDVLVKSEQENPVSRRGLLVTPKKDETSRSRYVRVQLRNGRIDITRMKKGQRLRLSGTVVGGGFSSYIIAVNRIITAGGVVTPVVKPTVPACHTTPVNEKKT